MKTSLNVEKKYQLDVFLEFSDYQDFDTTNKINSSLSQYSCKSVLLLKKFLMKHFELVVVEEHKFEN